MSLAVRARHAVAAVAVARTTPTGSFYALAALATGGIYVLYAWRFVREPARLPARRLFLSSLLVLQGALVTDLLVR